MVDREVLKYKVENVGWGHMIDEHGKAIKFLGLGEKYPIIWQLRFRLVLLQAVFYVKVRLRRS